MKKKIIIISILILLFILGLFIFLLNPFLIDESNSNIADSTEVISNPSAEIIVEESFSESTKTDNIVITNKDKSLHVEGTGLVDCNGNPVQLRGISTHGINWFPGYVNEACFQEFRNNWNVNVVRLAMYTAEYNGYCTGGDKETLKQLIRNGVNYAANQDLYVIIDWHILTDLTPTLYKEESKEFFAEMSSEFADYDNVLYEICNEPNGGTSWSEVKGYAEEIIPIIRANDEDAIIIVGTPNWSQYVNEAVADPITEYDNIMYTLHFYAATHKDSLRTTMVNAIDAGLPIFVTEYGICDASGDGAIDVTQADKWIELLDSYGISHVAWNLSNKAESSAILKSDCQKTSGFSENDLKDSGKWLYKMLTGREANTFSKNPSNTEDTPATEPENNESTESTSQDSAILSGSADHFITYSMNLENSWESDGGTYYQYSLILKNTGTMKCSEWNISIPFEDTISLSNGWNGNYTVDGNTLHISSMDYNGTIDSGKTIGDIGFIISLSK